MKHFANFVKGETVRRTAMAALTTLGMLAGSAATQAAELWNNWNTGGVSNVTVSPSGTFPLTVVSLTQPATVTQIATYHWNNATGEAPGTITMRSIPSSVPTDRFTFTGTFPAQGQAGSFNVPNVNWVANVNLTLPAGNYVVFDSSPATWSQNATSGGFGFVMVLGNYLPATTLFDNFNINGVVNDPTHATTFKLKEPAEITQLETYHWNNGAGEVPGIHDHITLSGFGSPIEFPVTGEPGGNGSVADAAWVALGLHLVLPPGTYTISDSSPNTWAQNGASSGEGFARVFGDTLSPQVHIPARPASGGGGGTSTPPPTTSCGGIPARFAVMSPCSGYPAAALTLTVEHTMPAPIASVVFYCVGAPFGPGNFCAQSIAAPTTSLINVTVLGAGITVTGTGVSAGNTYGFPVPLALAVGGTDSQWEAIAYDAAGGSLGSVGIFKLL